MISKKKWPALLLALPLSIYILYPLVAMLAESLTLPVADFRARDMGWPPEQQPFAAPLRRIFFEHSTLAAFFGTLKISALSVLTGGLWGLGLALLWGRREFPGRRFFAVLGYAPLLMPPLVGTLAFFSLLGEAGVVWHVISGGVPWLSGFAQVLAVHTYAFGVYTYAFAAAALSGTDFSREEAARNLGAGRWKTFCHALWPVLKSAVLAAALLTFMASAASFSAPYLLDNSSRYLTVEILNNGGDEGLQRALSTLLAVLSLAALPAFLYFQRQSRDGDLSLGAKGISRAKLPLASQRGAKVRMALSLVALLPLLAPPLMVLITTFLPRTAGEAGFFRNFSDLIDADWQALARSLGYGLATALIDVSVAAVIALTLRRAAPLFALPVELAVMLALALPGSTVAVALLSAFNGPSPLTAGVPLGHTASILVLAYCIRNLALSVRPVRAALSGIGNELEFAGANLGARRMKVLWRITLPLLLPSLLAAGLLCFINAAGEYVATMLLFDVATQPVSVRIDEYFRGELGRAYALAVILMAVCALVIGAARILAGKRWD